MNEEELPPINEDIEQLEKTLAFAVKAVADLKTNQKETVYLLEEDHFYIYDKGVYSKIYEIKLKRFIAKFTPRFNTFTINIQNQILERIKYLQCKDLKMFNWSPELNLKNCMISPYNSLDGEHSPIFYSTIQLPFEYNENAQCSLWLKTLGEIFEDNQEMISTLQEFFGYCLTKETKYEMALLLLGESRSGKSTILTVLRNVIGIQNCSSVALKNISNAQYTPLLINKLVNIEFDVSGNATDFEADFKTITSGEPVNCNQKHIPTFEFNPFCKLAMAANTFPRITDHSSAFYKRLLLIPCDRVFKDEEQNINLKVELLKELSGIFNWAMVGLQRLEARGKFEKHDFIKDAVKELREADNPSDKFFDECVIEQFGDGIDIEKSFLYEKYRDWCKKKEIYILSEVKFSQCVFRRYSHITPKRAQNLKTKKYVWRNIKYLEEYERQENLSWEG